MLQLNPIITTLTALQAHTAMMAQLTSTASSETVTINRQDLQIAFADIQQTISGICTQLSSVNEPTIDFDAACSEFKQQLSESAPTAAAPVMEMTEPCIVIKKETRNVDNRITKAKCHYYIPSISEEQRNKCTSAGIYKTYGVELPSYYQDIDVSRFTEKTYYDENGDQQRVLVPLFKDRRSGEHHQAFYQRVGLLLPPMD